MREILFRGKRLNGMWAIGCYVQAIGNEIITEIVDVFDDPTGSWLIDPETVGQYTGLKDKNGNKIFEGDIVQNISERKKGIVQWFEEHAAFLIYCQSENTLYWLYDNDFSNLEVIGNIHDNPELIGGGDE